DFRQCGHCRWIITGLFTEAGIAVQSSWMLKKSVLDSFNSLDVQGRTNAAGAGCAGAAAAAATLGHPWPPWHLCFLHIACPRLVPFFKHWRVWKMAVDPSTAPQVAEKTCFSATCHTGQPPDNARC
ncbi:MAG: hypothetical protein AABY62_03115, partial [Pseudomonadota bacterium]